MNITRQDLVEAVSDNFPDADNELISAILNSLINAITDELAAGNDVEFRNFGKFKIKSKKERIAHNPKTLKKVKVPDKKVCVFKAGKQFKEELQKVQPAKPKKIDIAAITSKLGKNMVDEFPDFIK